MTRHQSNSAAETFAVPLETTAGVFMAEFTAGGLRVLSFPKKNKSNTAGPVVDLPREVKGWAKQTQRCLEQTLAGQPLPELPPLDWRGATDFQQRVWKALLAIRPGATRSYGEIAADVGSPQGARAVGAACGANPIPVLVPCHRVLAGNRKLGGFSGGLDWKHRLLQAEGVQLL